MPKQSELHFLDLKTHMKSIGLISKLKEYEMKIAIDGTAGSGKGTLSYNLSKALKLPRLDTGLLYRKVAFYILSLKT